MAGKYICLSYMLHNDTPCYNGSRDVFMEPANSIAQGDGTNTLRISMKNHAGTHIDFPKHFLSAGKCLNDYPPEYLIFSNVGVFDIPLERGVYITGEMLENCAADSGIDFLIIKTGYGRFRSVDKYWNDNPGISFPAAECMKERFPKLRAVGMDFISVNAFHDKAEGRRAHKKLLSAPEVLIVEDMNLEALSGEITKLIISPLLIDSADGAPCNILAEKR